MKDRILHYLDDFSNGKSEDLAEEIISELKAEGIELSKANLKNKSREILELLLHRYSEFSISTIDAFFQRVIRSFTRETGLLGNFRLEVENKLVMEEVISLLMDQLSVNAELRGWVLDFSMARLTDGKNWDVRSALQDFAGLTDREEFKAIEDSVLEVTNNKDFFISFKKKLNDHKFFVENTIFGKAKEIVNEFEKNDLVADDFNGKGRGIFSYVRKLTNEIELPSPTVQEVVNDARKWAHKTSSSAGLINKMAQNQWQPQLLQLVEFIEANQEVCKSIDEVLKNLYSFGLLTDIVKTQKKYLAEENMMLLSDAPKFLNKLMQEQDASFIYEKVGSFYRHYLLDEFQDTSGLQWKNLLPLIQNGLAQNYKSLIVGDIKQSIYRWRGGDLSILQEKVNVDISSLLSDTHSLDCNYRSGGNLVNFNNEVFSTAADILAIESGTDFPKEAYHDAAQKIVINEGLGFVKIQFLPQPEKESSFKYESIHLLPKTFEALQLNGVAVKDIAFLVRDNKDGRLVADWFMEYRASAEAKEGIKYDVISNESLQLDRATSILILINALKILDNPNHLIAKAHLAYEYQKLWPTQAFTDWNEIFSSVKEKSFGKWMPSGFIQQQQRLTSLSLFEMVENLILLFNLGKLSHEIVYLQSFQDLVLEFSQREKNDLASFLDWWELNKENKSVQVAGEVDAAQIITIHKAKGLQFKYVIIPFLNWELDHKIQPILWGRSNHHLFKEAGYIPIKYKKDLNETLFKEYYQAEKKKVFLDNLNLLYVAFTRAESGLIAFAPEPPKKKSPAHVGHLLHQVLEANLNLLTYWSAAAQVFQMGEILPSQEKSDKINTASISNYVVTLWRERLQVRSSGMEFFQPTQQRKKVNHGIFLHSIFSQVRMAEDVPEAIDRAYKTGRIMDGEIKEITELVQWVVNHPQLTFYFSPESICKMESGLLGTDGRERRVDRVAMRGKYAWVLDYKTGDASAKDEEQVKDYMNLLKLMGKEDVKGYLVYVHEKRCVEVNM